MLDDGIFSLLLCCAVHTAQACLLASCLLRTLAGPTPSDIATALPHAQRALSLAANIPVPANNARALARRDELRMSAAREAGALMCAIGQPKDGQPHLKQALEISETLYGADADESMAVLLQLGKCLQASGQLEEAFAMLQKALAAAERVHGVSHVRTGAALSALGMALRQSGQLGRAEEVMRR